MKQKLSVMINKEPYEVEIEPGTTLLELLRDNLYLTGTKAGCSDGSCGACTVLLDGKVVKSCSVLALQADGKQVLTIEGLSEGGRLHPLQEAFVEYFAVQCGFCTPGMILKAKALLDENPRPTEEDVRAWLTGNICRCTGYVKIVEAILAAAEKAA
jgi:carbon-monoxide dehydrogenase small subunit